MFSKLPKRNNNLYQESEWPPLEKKTRDLFYFIGKIAAPSEKPHTFNTRQPESQSSSATLSDFFSFVIAFRTL